MNWKRSLAALGAMLCTLSVVAQTNSTPLFQFAIFYNSLLEFTWCGPMNITGPTYANGDIYTGSAWPLNFDGLVITTGSMSSPAWDGHSTSDYTNLVWSFPGYCTHPEPVTLSFGTTNFHAIIEMPPDGEDPNSVLSQQRYYNKANLILLVSNSTVTLTLKSSPADPQAASITALYFPTNSSPANYVQVTTNFPWLSITNTFFDQRENDVVKASDIDMSILKRWLVTNTLTAAKFPNIAGVYNISNAPGILYAADNRTYTNGQLTAVRLKNGSTIPTNMVTIAGNTQPSGFTVATPNPLYVWGNYNCPNPTYLCTTNTTTDYPASLVSDALTILSGAWLDSQSATVLGSSKNRASSTAVNAAILAGIVPSTGSDASSFSGGVHNLPRLLEDWGSGGAVALWLNTSIVNLFNSTRATNQFRAPGGYYQAPMRMFNFDPNFLDLTKLPPGTPVVGPTKVCFLTPPLDQTVSAGQTAIFNVAATGELPLGYIWRFNGTNIPNARSSMLVITNASASNAGYYSVIMENPFGFQISPNAVLTVNQPPIIYTQPVSLAVMPGGDVQFSVTAGGTAPLSYQWSFNGTNLADATDGTLRLTNVTTDQAGTYGITVTNLAGIASASATLSVYTNAAAVLTAPPGVSSEGFQFTITGVPGLNYAVEASTNLVDWAPLFTNTSPFTFVDGDATNIPGRYYRSVYLP
jgi:hypothetical protein